MFNTMQSYDLCIFCFFGHPDSLSWAPLTKVVMLCLWPFDWFTVHSCDADGGAAGIIGPLWKVACLRCSWERAVWALLGFCPFDTTDSPYLRVPRNQVLKECVCDLLTYCSMYNHCYAINEYTTAVSKQRLGKLVPAETNIHVTIAILWKRCFLCGPCRDFMSRTVWSNQFSWVLQGRVRKDGGIVESTVDNSSAWAAVTRRPERVKLKNLHP
jgi:hypothetical protein